MPLACPYILLPRAPQRPKPCPLPCAPTPHLASQPCPPTRCAQLLRRPQPLFRSFAVGSRLGLPSPRIVAFRLLFALPLDPSRCLFHGKLAQPPRCVKSAECGFPTLQGCKSKARRGRTATHRPLGLSSHQPRLLSPRFARLLGTILSVPRVPRQGVPLRFTHPLRSAMLTDEGIAPAAPSGHHPARWLTQVLDVTLFCRLTDGGGTPQAGTSHLASLGC